MELKEGNVKLEPGTNTSLTKISRYRRDTGNPIWRKKDVIAELVSKAFKKELK